jgi:hypothetical protein
LGGSSSPPTLSPKWRGAGVRRKIIIIKINNNKNNKIS